MLIIHWWFQLLLRSQGLFPLSRIQLTSIRGGVGGVHGQTANPSWPVEIYHNIDIMLSLWMRVGCGAGILSFPGVSTILFSSGSLNFPHEFSLFSVLWNSHNPWAPCSAIAARGQAMQLVVSQWEKKNCIYFGLHIHYYYYYYWYYYYHHYY